ncbi:MAG TPA: 4-(cytidine 5'-diphospho)-2-C-methyl-D-erythritol kinase [Candidatus Omnitrophica bacterium]|nr:4-(cytidine 5'-diphospho)-2-C-methyl-D-erythritol kinase [Candidatus Omnitrophota bacterium]
MILAILNKITINSPAKVNLFLELLHKREDGYWEIKTVLQEIDLYDEVYLRERKDGKVRVVCSDPSIEEEKNLAYRAAKLIQEKGRVFDKGVEVFIEKKIPIGRGLGGASSNAAAVLKGLKELWSLNLTQQELATLGAQLGMDIPFFIYGGTCLGTGRGETITPLPDFAGFPILLLWPEFSVSTPEVYRNASLSLTKKRKCATLLLKSLRSKDLDGVEKSLFNRLEEVALEIYPSLSQTKEKITSLNIGNSIMTGSGSAFFVFLPDAKDKEESIVQELRNFEGGYYVGKTS